MAHSRRGRRRVRGQKRWGGRVLLILIVICSIFYLYPLGKSWMIANYESLHGEPGENKITTSVADSEMPIHSRCAILIDLKDRRILYEKESEEKVYPASLTKIMTVIVAIENMPDLQKKFTLSARIFKQLNEEGASMAGFIPDEKVKGIDLLYGAMLPSGADATGGLAFTVADSEEDFVKLMNEKAQALGMKETHFENVNGLQAKDHYTTVQDLALLLKYALQNPTFREIFTSAKHVVAPTNKHPDGITFYSTLFQEMGEGTFNGGKIIGGKTGYTKEAGLCLASLAERNDNREYLLITAGAKGDHQTEQYNISDALSLYSKYLSR